MTGDERDLEQRLVGAGDAHGDGLGLVLDRVDRAGQLLDGLGQRRGQVVDHHGRRAHLALVDLVGVQRDHAEHVPEQAGQAHGGRGLELAVVAAHPQAVEVAAGHRLQVGAQAAQQRLAVVPAVPRRGCRPASRCAARASAGPGQGVDGQRRLVAEQVPRHDREHERERRMGTGTGSTCSADAKRL